MPIKPDQRARYPADWKLRSRFVRFYRARNRCEWCRVFNGRPHFITGARVVLTVAHIYDDRPEAAGLLNLAALCQQCHNQHDAKARHHRRAERDDEAARYVAEFPKAKLTPKPKPGRCPLYGCRNKARCRGVLCAKHEQQLRRRKNPAKSFFNQIKQRAGRRNIPFTLTFDQFIEAVAETGYLEGRGRASCMLHLDRDDATKGYEAGNIVVRTARQNCQKSHEDKARRRAFVEARIGRPLPAHDDQAHEEASTHMATENEPF